MSFRFFQKLVVLLVALTTLAISTVFNFAGHPTFASSSSSSSSQTSIIVDYGASGYHYLEVPTGADQGFQAPTYDDSAFHIGSAAFGLALNGCPLDSTIQTNWDSNTDMLVRRDITLPPGTTSLAIHVAIDNDVVVYWNGTQVGATTHDGCAAQDTLIANVPASVLTNGSNVLAVRGTDRGASTYLDLQIVATISMPSPTPPPTSCSRPVGTAGTTPDYCIPPDWNTLYVNTVTPGVEPLNVIISARSTVSLSNILAALTNWGSTPSCISPEQANVAGNYLVQQDSWRYGAGCSLGNYFSLFGLENHARLWNQPVPGSTFGAWFIGASYETACVLRNGQLLPLRKLNGSYRHGKPWHCIDGGAGSYFSNGYNSGAKSLAANIIQVAHQKGWYATMRIDARPAGIGEDRVHFNGQAYVLTVDYTPPTA